MEWLKATEIFSDLQSLTQFMLQVTYRTSTVPVWNSTLVEDVKFAGMGSVPFADTNSVQNEEEKNHL